MIRHLLTNGLILSVFYPLSLWADSATTYSHAELQSSVISTAFYTGSVVMLVVFALFNLSLRNTIGLWYTLLCSVGLMFVACLDGTGANILWANYSEVGQWLPLTVIFILNACGLLLAAHTLDTSAFTPYAKLKYLMQIFGYLNVLSIALIPLIALDHLAFWANIAFILMILSQVLTTISWRTPGKTSSENAFRYSGIFSSVSSLIFLFATIVTAVLIWYQSQQIGYSYSSFILISARVIYLILSVSLITTLMAHIIGMQKDHDHALHREVQSARRAVKASRDKLEAERDFMRMREIARQRRQQLSAASHDIRQPLVSLQLTLDKLRRSCPSEQEDEYQRALNYIKQLASSYKDNNIEFDVGDQSKKTIANTGNRNEQLPIKLLFQTIQQMFGPEANEKNVELRTVPTTLEAFADPGSVIRITSNLVSNALAHTSSSKILLGCRRRGNSISIEIYDQGKGLSQEEFEHMQHLHNKGPDSQGEGIGLATCIAIANTRGYQLSLRSAPQQGSCFALLIPRQFYK